MWSFTPASRSAQALKHECETLSGPCALLVVWFPEVHRNLNHKVQVTKSGISSNFVEVGISKFLEFLSSIIFIPFNSHFQLGKLKKPHQLLVMNELL